MDKILSQEIRIKGVVQGVGFRPFCVRCATLCNIKGYVLNDSFGVKILAQGTKEALENFTKHLQNPPIVAKITHFEQKRIKSAQIYTDFSIQKSKTSSKISAIIPADIAMCEDCLKEFRDKNNRRFAYPFISCTNCGARYSLIKSLPYDRKNSAMAEFKMCELCQNEYDNPNSRRFHSEINCCETCGPKLYFSDNLESFKQIFKNENELDDASICKNYPNLFAKNPLQSAINALKNGKILALKGIGGYTLICNALNKDSIKALRERKMRPSKPFAIMCKDILMARNFAQINDEQIRILRDKKAPILLLKAKDSKLPLEQIAPNLGQIGIILPYAPLHYLLFKQIDFPLIFTSANISKEPIIKDFAKIIEHLSGVCDCALLFNRNIINAIDDSLVSFEGALGEQVLRRARGYLNDVSEFLPLESKESFLAYGAQQKATFCYKTKQNLLLSSHLGDLDTLATIAHFKHTKELFTTHFNEIPQTFAFDLHPHYAQRQFLQNGTNAVFIQHHFAHLLSNVLENKITKKTLGVIFDGTGFGLDGRIWGGEFLEWDPKNPLEFLRIATFTPLVLFGAQKAIKDVRRLGLSALLYAYGSDFRALKLPFLERFSDFELDIFCKMQEKGEVLCTSVGRLFDAIASLCGVDGVSFEGEAAMRLESLAKMAKNGAPYEFSTSSKNPILIDTSKIIKGVCNDLLNGVNAPQIALNFHLTLAQIIKEIAKNYDSIALSGGVFCNTLLSTKTLELLADKEVHLHHNIPCNDGGISFGQANYLLLKSLV